MFGKEQRRFAMRWANSARCVWQGTALPGAVARRGAVFSEEQHAPYCDRHNTGAVFNKEQHETGVLQGVQGTEREGRCTVSRPAPALVAGWPVAGGPSLRPGSF